MTPTWAESPENTESDLVWTLDSLVVNAAKYDTGEWIIKYGGSTPTTLYRRNIYSRSEALREANVCMRGLTEYITQNKRAA